MKYGTRDINYEKDKTFLIDLMDKYLEFIHGSQASIEWNYESNPISNARGSILLAGDDDNNRLGCITVLKREFKLGNDRKIASLLADFVVEKEHRSLGPAIALAKHAINTALEDTPFVYGFPTTKALPVFKVIGFKIAGKLTRYARIVNYRKLLKSKLPVPLVGCIVGLIIDLFYSLFLVYANYRLRTRFTLTEVKTFSREINSLIDNSEFSSLVINTRNSDYLNWRYFDNPQHIYKGFVLTGRKGDIQGYYVIELVDDVIHISDIFGITQSDIITMLDFIQIYAFRNNYQSVSFSFMGPKILTDSLVHDGFHARESERCIIFKSLNPDVSEKLAITDNWYLTDGDEDQ